ncbi:MAG: hypothetical protein K9L17_07190 [Clostridiales bacterium]|nr:hypothetical protein [Clostridiales bacterium]
MACLLALVAGCLNNSAEKGLIDNAFRNLDNAESYEARMDMDIEVIEPLEMSINKKMNMLYENNNGKGRMYTEVKELTQPTEQYAVFEVMIDGTDVSVKIEDFRINDVTDSDRKKSIKSKEKYIHNEVERKKDLYGVRYYEKMILEARKDYKKVEEVQGFEDYDTYRVILDNKVMLDYCKKFLKDEAEEENWAENWDVKIENVKVYVAIDPDSKLIKQIDWEMKEIIKVRHENEDLKATVEKYDGTIKYLNYNEPIDFPKL